MLKKIVSRWFFVLFCSLLFMFQPFQYSVFGASKDVMSKESAGEILKVIMPDVKVLSVGSAPVDGLWEVALESGGEKGIAYIDFAGKNVVFGSIIDAATKTNLTKKKFDEINKIDVSLIPLKDSIVMGNSMARHKVIVFDDPDCPYCAKLHEELKRTVEQRKDIVVYFKLFPLVQIHPQAYKKSTAIACEKSNEKALSLLDDAFAKKTIPEPSCETKIIDENMKLAKKLGISSTPILILDDGRVVRGAVKAEDLIKAIDNK
ncbi:MAG: DsbC family protein [Nitrospirota bacterium]